MYKDPTLDSFINNRSLPEKPLTTNEEAYYNWYLSNNDLRQRRCDRKKFTSMNKFSGIYSPSSILNDQKHTADIRKNFIDKTERADIFESIIANFAENAEWFNNAYVIETEEYDDVANGVDFVLEIETDDNEVLRLALDVTVGEESTKQEKISRIVNEIKMGKLTKVKYFQSEAEFDDDGNQKMLPLYQIPKIILSIEKDKLDDLCKKIVQVTKNEKGTNKALSEIDFKNEIIDEIVTQLQEIINLISDNKKRFNNSSKLITMINKIIKQFK